MKERYNVIKILYPDYLILFCTKDGLKCFGKDKLLVNYFGMDGLINVNKIILNNLDIEKIEKYHYNRYEEYCNKYQLIKSLVEVINEK